MIIREQLIEVGQYNKPHGVNGEISASLDSTSNLLSSFSCLISEIDGIFVPFFVKSSRSKSSQSILLNIDGIQNEYEAALLVNKTIFVLKSEYGKLLDETETDELPIDFFIGFSVFQGKAKKAMGEICDVDDSTANILFKIKTTANHKEILVPAVEEFIDDIDMEKKAVYMSIPNELLEL